MAKRKPAVFEILDQALPKIQTRIVDRVEARIAEGAVVTSVAHGTVTQHHRKKKLVHA